LIIQGGAFGEHQILRVTDLSAHAAPGIIHDRHVQIVLPPGRSLDLRLEMRHYAATPSYAGPNWY
jgi:hypothetical protein